MALLLVAGAAIAAASILATVETRSLAFTLGVVPQQVAVSIAPGHEACQRPLDVSSAFGYIRLVLGTYARPGPRLELSVRHADGNLTLGEGRLLPGYPDNSTQTVKVRPISGNVRAAVCVRNRGKGPVALYGGSALAARTSTATLDGKVLPSDISLVFVRQHKARLLSLLPVIFRRAALFHPAWLGPWTFWLLGGLFLLVPVGLALAVSRAEAR